MNCSRWCQYAFSNCTFHTTCQGVPDLTQLIISSLVISHYTPVWLSQINRLAQVRGICQNYDEVLMVRVWWCCMASPAVTQHIDYDWLSLVDSEQSRTVNICLLQSVVSEFTFIYQSRWNLLIPFVDFACWASVNVKCYLKIRKVHFLLELKMVLCCIYTKMSMIIKFKH